MFNGGLDKIRQYVLLKYNGKYTITWSHGYEIGLFIKYR
jgi:hypothetical protein